MQNEKVELKCFTWSIQTASGPHLRNDSAYKPLLLLPLELVFSFLLI